MTPSEIIAVVQAFMDGKTIQSRSRNTGGVWEDIPYPIWSFHAIEYRVKTVPRVLYAVYDKGGKGKDRFLGQMTLLTGETVEDAAGRLRGLGYTVVKYVEEVVDAD